MARLQAAAITQSNAAGITRSQFLWTLQGGESTTYRQPLMMVLNPMVSALQGESRRGARYATLALSDLRSVSDVATLLYVRLAGWIDWNREGRQVTENVLLHYVWPTRSAADRTERHRHGQIRRALRELAGLGWDITGPEGDRHTYRIGRPKGGLS